MELISITFKSGAVVQVKVEDGLFGRISAALTTKRREVFHEGNLIIRNLDDVDVVILLSPKPMIYPKTTKPPL